MSVAQVLNVLGEVSEEEDVVLANLAGDFDLECISLVSKMNEIRTLTLAPSQVPMIKPPFKQNFIFEVPDASVPAVEMCSLMSLAGQMISALLTL
jgi:hypothetical protein